MALRSVWVARKLSDGSIRGVWWQAVKPDPDNALPGESGSTIEILEVPYDVVMEHGGPDAFLMGAVGGKALLDDFHGLKEIRERPEEAVRGSVLPGSSKLDHGSFEGLGDDDHTGYQLRSEKGAANGYAGLDASARTSRGADATDDLIVDSTTKGVVLKDTAGHYWREGISTLGVPFWTDLGTTKP